MEHNILYVLTADFSGTMRSSQQPIGLAVTSEEEAKRYVKDGGVGYSHGYEEVIVCVNKDAGLSVLKAYKEQKRVKQLEQNYVERFGKPPMPPLPELPEDWVG